MAVRTEICSIMLIVDTLYLDRVVEAESVKQHLPSQRSCEHETADASQTELSEQECNT